MHWLDSIERAGVLHSANTFDYCETIGVFYEAHFHRIVCFMIHFDIQNENDRYQLSHNEIITGDKIEFYSLYNISV